MPRTVELRASVIEERLRVIHELIQRLTQEQEVLSGWRERAFARSNAVHVPRGVKGLPPVDAIDHLLTHHPGLTRLQVADALQDVVRSRADSTRNIRAAILTSVRRKLQDGTLLEDEDGRLHLVEG